MKATTDIIESLSERVEAYAKTSIDLIGFRSIGTGLAGASSLISVLGGPVIIALPTFFLSIGAAMWLGDWLGKAQYGFFAVALMYLIAGVALRYACRRSLAKFSSELNLQTLILQLENQKAIDMELLKSELHEAYENIRPINLIKSTLKEVAESPDLHNNAINALVGLGTGYLSKSLFERVSHNPLKKIVGIALLFGVTNVISKNPAIARTMGKTALNLFKK
jgi:hypothetical protein